MRKVRWLGPSDTALPVHVRYRPLGSPWDVSKRSYGHVAAVLVTGVVRVTGVVGCGAGVGYREGIPGGYREVLYRVLPTHPPGIALTGIARAQPVARHAYLRPPGTPARLHLASAHLAPRTQICLLGPI